MTVIYEAGYTLPGGDEPLSHARIAHAGNWNDGTVAASGTATGFFADGPNNSLTYERWKPDALPATWELDVGTAQTIDYCAIGAHTMGTNGNTLEVQEWDAGLWTDLIPATAITTDAPIFCIFTPASDTRFRIRITNGTTPLVGVVKFGQALQMERPLYGEYSPPDFARATELRAAISETGEFLGRTRQRSHLEFSMQWRLLTRAWADANWLPAMKQLESEPFFLAPIPSVRDEVVLGQVIQPGQVTESASGFLSAGLSIRGRAYD